MRFRWRRPRRGILLMRSNDPFIISMDALERPEPGDPEVHPEQRRLLLGVAAAYAVMLEGDGDPRIARLGEILLERARGLVRARWPLH